MLLLGILPPAALALAAALLHRRGRELGEAITVAALLWAYGTALANEALGLVRAIAFPSLLAGWSLAVGLLVLALWRAGGVAWRPRTWPARISAAAAALMPEEWILAAALAIVGVPTLLLALISPPNNWDSQVYHLARIEHWIENGSFAIYRTAIHPQVDLPALAELLLLQLRLLTGGDRLLNLLQWLAGAGSVFLVGRIGLALGASRSGAALARLTIATLPIGILEASSTQNDLVASFFVLAFAERLLAWRRSRGGADAAYAAIAAGLSLAAKGTAYLVGFPLGLWFLAAQLRGGRRALLPLVACGGLILLPNLAYYGRNLAYTGSPVGSASRDNNNNAAYGLGDLALNGARNLAINLATPDRGYDRWLTRVLREGLTAVGLNPDAPELTLGSTRFALTPYQNSEDSAANPVQMVLALAGAAAVLLAAPSGFPRRRYVLCVAVATLLFLLVLRWQPWITRLQLPIFALSAPLVAFLPFPQGQGQTPRQVTTAAMALLTLLLLAVAAPALWENARRPLFAPAGTAGTIWTRSPEDLLFTARPGLRLSYESAAAYAARHGYARIGLVTNVDDWEYPLWRLLRRAGIKDLRIEHVGIADPAMARPYPLGPFDPMAVFVLRRDAPAEMTIDGSPWYRVQQYPALSIYEPAPP